MRLSAKILRNVSNVNSFQYDEQAYLAEGSTNEFYFQLVDLSRLTYGKDSQEYPDHPLRYMPAVGATISAEFDSLYDDEKFAIMATQPFANDTSIWKVSFQPDQLPKTGNFSITLTEGSSVQRFTVKQAITVSLLAVGGC